MLCGSRLHFLPPTAVPECRDESNVSMLCQVDKSKADGGAHMYEWQVQAGRES